MTQEQINKIRNMTDKELISRFGNLCGYKEMEIYHYGKHIKSIDEYLIIYKQEILSRMNT